MKHKLSKYREIISYLFFGVATTLVNWILYSVSIELIEFNMAISNGISWFGSVLFAYIVNRIFVFRSKASSMIAIAKEIVLFFSSRIVSGVIEIFLPSVLYDIGLSQSVFGVKGSLAKIVVSIVTVILNYVFSKLIIFKKEKTNKES